MQSEDCPRSAAIQGKSSHRNYSQLVKSLSSSEAVETAAAESEDGSVETMSIGGDTGSRATTADALVVEEAHGVDRRFLFVDDMRFEGL
jgi:hypothetical protein